MVKVLPANNFDSYEIKFKNINYYWKPLHKLIISKARCSYHDDLQISKIDLEIKNYFLVLFSKF